MTHVINNLVTITYQNMLFLLVFQVFVLFCNNFAGI